jgi:acyl transferase domain-containing protein
MPWPSHLPLRRVCVNSFGYGGTNGHTIVESLGSVLPGLVGGIPRSLTNGHSKTTSEQKYLLPFSAHDRPTLLRNIAKQRAYMKSSEEPIRDLAYTLTAGRSLLDYRGFTVAGGDELDAELDPERIATGDARNSGKSPQLGFVFTGMSV